MLLLSYPNCHRTISFHVTFWSSSFSSLPMVFGTEQGNSCPSCAGGMENISKISFYVNIFRIFSLLLVGSTPIWIYNVPIIWAVCMKASGVWRAVWDLQTNEWISPASEEAFIKQHKLWQEYVLEWDLGAASTHILLCCWGRLSLPVPILDQGTRMVPALALGSVWEASAAKGRCSKCCAM